MVAFLPKKYENLNLSELESRWTIKRMAWISFCPFVMTPQYHVSQWTYHRCPKQVMKLSQHWALAYTEQEAPEGCRARPSGHGNIRFHIGQGVTTKPLSYYIQLSIITTFPFVYCSSTCDFFWWTECLFASLASDYGAILKLPPLVGLNDFSSAIWKPAQRSRLRKVDCTKEEERPALPSGKCQKWSCISVYGKEEAVE